MRLKLVVEDDTGYFRTSQLHHDALFTSPWTKSTLSHPMRTSKFLDGSRPAIAGEIDVALNVLVELYSCAEDAAAPVIVDAPAPISFERFHRCM